MNISTYRPKAYRIVLNLFYGIGASIVAYFIAGIWLNPLGCTLVAIAIALLYGWLVIWNNMIEIRVDQGILHVRQGKKTRSFNIDECSFEARTRTSSGDTECRLTITDINGQVDFVDCELIGVNQFMALIEDLKIIGDDAPVQTLETKRKP